MYQEILQELSSLLKAAVKERDEASERLQKSIEELSRLQKLFNTILLSEEQQVLPTYHPEVIEETNRYLNCGSYNHLLGESPSRFTFASPLDFVISSPAMSDSGSYSYSSNQMGLQNRRDYETVVLESLGGGVLPENGKFLKAVSEAGQKLESLLITGSVPKWRNPPVQVSTQRPVMNYNLGHSLTGNWISGGLELGSGMLNRSFPCKKARFSLMS